MKDYLNDLSKEVIGAAIEVLTYLKMSGKHLGLLINFHTVRLADEIKRLVHNLPE